MKANITVIGQDGIGAEVTNAGVEILQTIAKKYGHEFKFSYALFGGEAIDKLGMPFPESTRLACLASDAILLGAVGGKKWDTLSSAMRPETALLGIRNALGLFANLRPAILYPTLRNACPLREDIAIRGINILVVRELIGGIYFGKRDTFLGKNGEEAYDTEQYNEQEIERIAHIAFQEARQRRKKVTSVDKANVLDSSKLWRKVVHHVALSYPDITLTDLYVDNAAMQLVKDPSQFDVLLTTNMFGDILSDEAAMITGSIGILASESRGNQKPYLYEPIHGSAPDIAGQNIANPIATILSCAMLLHSSLNLIREAQMVRRAVEHALSFGYRTADIYTGDGTLCSTTTMTKMIADYILENTLD